MHMKYALVLFGHIDTAQVQMGFPQLQPKPNQTNEIPRHALMLVMQSTNKPLCNLNLIKFAKNKQVHYMQLEA